MAVAMALTVLPAGASADGHDDEAIYLSMGTSLSAGTMADQNGNSQPFTNKSFTDRLRPRLQEIYGGGLEHVKLGCPGETTTTMVSGGLCDYDAGSQLAEAVALLESGADVRLITFDLGANDILQATPEIVACGTDQGCIAAIFGQIGAGIAEVLGAIRLTGYDGPILAMNYYNPNLAAWVNPDVTLPPGLTGVEWAQLSTQLAAAFNDVLDIVYGNPFLAVTVVDVESAFRTLDFGDSDADGVPNNVETVCTLSDMCPSKPGARPNIHLSPKGYLFLSRVFLNYVS